MRRSMIPLRILASCSALLVAACENSGPTNLEPAISLHVGSPPPPGLVTVTAHGTTFDLWPYTGTDLSGMPQDPINLVFTGVSDPRNVRDALLSVDGTRLGPLAPFNCTWKDAIGGQQTSYTEPGGWTGSLIQLECGDYAPFRFHLRLFPAGNVTVANAHVDVLIPGTTDHQVLSWDLGESIVVFDLIRSGYHVGGPGQTGVINEVGTFRSIPPVIYNGLPPHLRALTGGGLANVTEPVGIQTNGSATIVALREAPRAGGRSQDIVVPFGQFIPKPFCNDGGNDWVRVDGPVRLRQDVRVSASGTLTSQTMIDGELLVRSFNPLTGQVGPANPATVRDHYRAQSNGRVWSLASSRHQQLATATGLEELHQQLQVGSAGARYRSSESCGQ